MPQDSPAKSASFEEAMKDLEQTVELLANGNLNLEESMKKFEHGVALIKTCQTALNQAEKTVRVLVEKNRALQLEEFNGNNLTLEEDDQE